MAKKTKDIQYYQATGRRKESVARVRFYLTNKEKSTSVKGKKYNVGDVIINDILLKKMFPSEADQKKLLLPLEETKSLDRFVVSVHVSGGGRMGQIEAIALGIARALCVLDEAHKAILKPLGMLTRDPRVRERRKVGKGGKARRAKQSPKR